MDKLIVWQRVEGLLVFVAGLVLYWQLGSDLPWWVTILAFFVPDLSFLGYTIGSRFGAALYNSVHLYAFGVVLMALGHVFTLPLVAALGTLWLAHSGFDRMFGYGLKSDEGFGITHLGRIGKAK
jgi:hypothetical protein